jgi:hypothetical protein
MRRFGLGHRIARELNPERVLILLEKLKRFFDLRDVLAFGGLFVMGYGLYLLRPWIAFAVCGGILMLMGYLMKDKQ